MLRILIALLLTVTSTVQAAHITDKLLVGLYDKPDSATPPAKILPSGTPLEVLGKKGDFSQVRLGDGTKGWIKKDYISNEKPARTMLLELQAKASTLQKKLSKAEKDLKAAKGEAKAASPKNILKLEQELAASKKKLAAVSSIMEKEGKEAKRLRKLLEKTKPGSAEGKQIGELQKKLEANETELEATLHEAKLLQDLLKKTDRTASQRIAVLEQELLQSRKQLEESSNAKAISAPGDPELQKEITILRQRLNQAAEILGAPLPAEVEQPESGFDFSLWMLLLVVFILVVGFGGGIFFSNHRISRRYGGFRI